MRNRKPEWNGSLPLEAGRTFANGIARAVLANREQTAEELERLLVARTKSCLATLRAGGFCWSVDSDLMTVADEAQRFIDELEKRVERGETANVELELCSDMLGAIAVYHDATKSDAGALNKAARLTLAALQIGRFEALLIACQTGVLDAASLAGLRHEKAVKDATDSAQIRKKKARAWKDQALADFQSRVNKNVTAEAWSASNHQKYNVKRSTLAKALQSANRAARK